VQAVSATLIALPSATAYATQPPYETATPYATASPYPIATAYETATLYPTDTPYPTFTPTSTTTPEPTPMPTMAVQALPVQPTIPASPAGLTKAGLLQMMQIAHNIMGQVSGVINSASADEMDVDCVTAVQIYDAFVPIPAVNLAGSSAALQNAYGAYQAAVQIVIDNNGLIEDCRHKLTTSGAGSIPAPVWSYFLTQLNRGLDSLAQAIQQLQIAPDA
jgi:hypothetical protein